MNLTIRSQKLFGYLYPDFGFRIACIREDYFRKHKLWLQISETIRSFKKQNELYAKGRSMPGAIVTKARGGFSDHHYGVGNDFIFPGADPYLEKLRKSGREGQKQFDTYWEDLGEIVEENGCVWGGRWKGLGDKPHVCIHYGVSIQDMYNLFIEKRDLAALWAEFDRILMIEKGKGYASKDAPFKAVPYWFIMGEQPNSQGDNKNETI